MKNKSKIISLATTDFLYGFFSYGIDAVLIIYLIKVVGDSEFSALHSLSVKSCIIYSLPILTTFISNRYISNVFIGLIGLILMSTGLILLSTEGFQNITLSLSLLTVGYALGRPVISIVLGEITSKNNNLKYIRILYLISNIALLISPLVFSLTINQSNKIIFIMLGMVALINSLVYTIIYFKEILKNSIKTSVEGIFIVFILIIIVNILLQSPQYLKFIFLIAILTMLFYLIKIFQDKTSCEIQYLKSFMKLILTAFIFFIFFSQQYFFMPLFIEKYINFKIYNIKILTSWFVIINPFTGIILSPILAKLSSHYVSRNLSTFVLFLTGLSFLTLAIGTVFTKYIVLSVFFTYVLLAVAELMLVPHILSIISKWKIDYEKSILIGFLYLSMAFSKICAPYLTFWIGFPKNNFNNILSAHYLKCFMIISVLLFLGAIFFKSYSIKKT